MLIKCPECQVIYELDDTLVSEKGLKMRCSSCGNVFKAYPQDAVDDEKTAEEKKLNILKMFRRFENQREDLFDSSEPSQTQNKPTRIRVVHSVHYKNTLNYFLVFLILFIIAAFLYFMRYDIVRIAPNIEGLYQKVGIDSIYKGTKLQFTNVKTQEIVADNVSKIKINGIIDNLTPYEMSVLPIKVIIYSQDNKQLLNTTHYLPQTRIRPNYKIPFEFVITNPTPNRKNIYITFEDN